jgi:excisionase family DNA binding protein
MEREEAVNGDWLGDLTDIKEAARRTKTSPKVWYHACATGTLPHYRIGRLIRVSLAEVLATQRRGRGRPPRTEASA